MLHFHRTSQNARNLLRHAAVCGLVLGLAACQQYSSPADLLFAPSYNSGPGSIPVIAGTQYDCRTFQGSGWKGIAGGRADNWGNPFPVSRAACFQTREECQAFLNLMSGYIDYQPYLRCQPYAA
jgi:hypothetical protein